MKTSTVIIIKPGSVWKAKGQTPFAVVRTNKHKVFAVMAKGHQFQLKRSLFGKATGYLPVEITTPALVRQ